MWEKWIYIIDFYCKEQNLAIEVDGKYHEKMQEYDKSREEFLKAYTIRIIRFDNEEVFNKTEIVLKALEEMII